MTESCGRKGPKVWSYRVERLDWLQHGTSSMHREHLRQRGQAARVIYLRCHLTVQVLSRGIPYRISGGQSLCPARSQRYVHSVRSMNVSTWKCFQLRETLLRDRWSRRFVLQTCSMKALEYGLLANMMRSRGHLGCIPYLAKKVWSADPTKHQHGCQYRSLRGCDPARDTIFPADLFKISLHES